MAFHIIYSRAFLEKVYSLKESSRSMLIKAAHHAALDPDNNDYARDYLTPYRQKHPTSNHQYTLYFLIISPSELFFAWVNDDFCLHDTRNQLTDPCLKEFRRLLGRGEIETYDTKFHKAVFEVHPDKSKPIRCRSRYLGYEITLNTYLAAANHFIGHAFGCDEPIFDIAVLHTKEFFENLHSILVEKKYDFEIQFTKLGHEQEIKLLTQSFDSTKWAIMDDAEDFVLRKK